MQDLEVDINVLIGKRLKNIRINHGLSLDEVSKVTGVSKSMIGQIERGESAPTVTTLWKICNGLNITLSTLLEEDIQDITIRRKDEIVPLKGEKGEFNFYLYFSFSPTNDKFDLHYIEVMPRKYRVTEPVKLASWEILFVVKGSISLYENGKELILNKGDAMKIKSTIQYDYENKSDEIVELMSIQIY